MLTRCQAADCLFYAASPVQIRNSAAVILYYGVQYTATLKFLTCGLSAAERILPC
jgi:hypothetical protein